MNVVTRPLKPGLNFACALEGIDITNPISDEEFTILKQAFNLFSVVVLPNQDITDDQQIDFSRRFGNLERSLTHSRFGGKTRPEISCLSNIEENGKIRSATHERSKNQLGNTVWHTDSSFKPIPADLSILSARKVPEIGGETEFADSRMAYDKWPGSYNGISKDELSDLVCIHSIVYSRALVIGDVFTEEEKTQKVPPVRQALVRQHPETQRKAFFVGSHCKIIEGWDYSKSRALINELVSWITKPEFTYLHRWQSNDVVIWDNRCILHRGNRWPHEKFERTMHRTTVAGKNSTVSDGRF